MRLASAVLIATVACLSCKGTEPDTCDFGLYISNIDNQNRSSYDLTVGDSVYVDARHGVTSVDVGGCGWRSVEAGWTTSDANVAVLDVQVLTFTTNHYIVAKSVGTATITAHEGSQTDAVTVTVTP